MSAKVRKEFYLDSDKDKEVKRLAELSGVGEGEIILQALDTHLPSLNHQLGTPQSEEERLALWREECRFIEDWITLGPPPGGRTWRREDIYDRWRPR